MLNLFYACMTHKPCVGFYVSRKSLLLTINLKIPFSKWRPFCLRLNELTHWGRSQMAAILQTSYSKSVSSMEEFEFEIKFHWVKWVWFPMVQLTISQHWFRYWIGACSVPSHYPSQWLSSMKHIHGLVQDCGNSFAIALELLHAVLH